MFALMCLKWINKIKTKTASMSVFYFAGDDVITHSFMSLHAQFDRYCLFAS